MLDAIKEIGEFKRNKIGKDELSTLVENPNNNGAYKNVITINFNEDLSFNKVDLEQFDSSKIDKYLYRKGASNGADISPTAKIAGDFNKTFKNKIKKWFSILENKSINLKDDERDFLEKLKTCINENETNILESIREKLKSVPKKENAILTLKLKQNNEWKYIGDFDLFKNLFLEIEYSKDNDSVPDQKCSMCSRSSNVSGKVDTFKFYTIDKPGFITGGFNKSIAWKNFPVCHNCKLSLEEGRKFIEKQYNFCGLKYHLIPKFFFNINEEVLEIFENGHNSPSLKDRDIKRITDDDNEILDIIKDEEDYLTLNFLFLEKNNSAEKILLLIEDVFPSRLKKIFEAKNQIDELYKKEESFNFSNIRYFFTKSDKQKRDYDFNRYFLEIVNSVFKDKKIDFQFLVKFFMGKIRSDLSNSNYIFTAVENALKDIIFFEKLNLVIFEKEEIKMGQFDNFFNKFGDTFKSPIKKGLFLLGSLAEILIEKQYSQGKTGKPFLKQLKGLKMNEQDIKGLLPKIQSKFQEYNAFDDGKKKIASEVADCLLTAGDNWKLSVDEINFYLACGMCMVAEIKDIVYPKKDGIITEQKNN